MRTELRKTLFLLLCLSLLLCLAPAALAAGGNVVTIPAGVTLIESEAFADCQNMTAVRIPAGVKRIGPMAFAGCDALKEVFFEGSESDWLAVNIDDGNGPLVDTIITCAGGQRLVPVNERYFPDEYFRGLVASSVDTNHDGLLNDAERAAVERFGCSGTREEYSPVTSIQGIEFFPNLTHLYCQFGQISSLDVSALLNLEVFYCPNNLLTSLDVTHNPKLKILSCVYNQITTLDVSKNPLLELLCVSGNGMDSLDLSANVNLKNLYCHYNNLRTLDLSNCKAMEGVFCAYNEMDSLNLSANVNLKNLYCPYNNLRTLDLSNCKAMEDVSCAYNEMMSSIKVSGCPELVALDLSGNDLTSLDVSRNKKLQELWMWRNDLTGKLDLSQNAALVRVNLSANHNLTSVSLPAAQNLELLKVQNTGITGINIRNCPIIRQAFLQGTYYDFTGVYDSGSFWGGYKLGDGINPDSTREVDHCQFTVNKDVQITA